MRAITTAIALVALVACGGRSGTGDYGAERATIDLQVVSSPSTNGPSALALTLSTPGGQPIAGADVAIEGQMTHAGMAPVNTRAVEQGAGRYMADGFRFTMGGDWLLIVRATLPDGGKVQRTFPVDGVKEGGVGTLPLALVGR